MLNHTKEITTSQICRDSFSGIYPTWKDRGETLAMFLKRFRTMYLIGTDIKLTYAGRLDPMAEGIVLVLAGNARFQKDDMLELPKTYRVDVLLGISTDTYDPLGLITNVSLSKNNALNFKEIMINMISITSLPYPIYSSVPVLGKPLFVHARSGIVVKIPSKKVSIFSVDFIEIKRQSIAVLTTAIVADIEKVEGDFRQEKILQQWKNFAVSNKDAEVAILQIEVAVSSGTYMRSLAVWIGEELNVPALAYRIIRNQIGEYTIKK